MEASSLSPATVLQMLTEHAWAWALFAVYLVLTSALAWRGGQMTSSKEGFAIGTGKMHPIVAGVTLGACLASSATFVIFPGFVYKDGLAALLGFSVPLIAGLATGLALFAPRFQDIGGEHKALTVPHWLGARYDSDTLRRLFAGLNILNIAYLVLIAVGCGYVMEAALGLPYAASVVLIVGFVFAYTGFGGAWAHAFTNTAQGILMLFMAVVIFASGLRFWSDGSLVADLSTTGLIAQDSVLFSTTAEVWLVPFVMGIALTTQPHLLTKALYVEGKRDLWRTIGIGIGTFTVFCLVLFAGAYARLTLDAGIPQDQVVARYLAEAFPIPAVGAAVSVAILAASMSTMDGLLVAISASVGNDLFPGKGSVRLNQGVLAGLAVITILIALSPPKLVLILGQQGVYGLVAASAGPLVAGLFMPGVLRGQVAVGVSLLALAIHFGLGVGAGLIGLDLGPFSTNPGVAAGVAMAVTVPLAFVLARVLQPAGRPTQAAPH